MFNTESKNSIIKSKEMKSKKNFCLFLFIIILLLSIGLRFIFKDDYFILEVINAVSFSFGLFIFYMYLEYRFHYKDAMKSIKTYLNAKNKNKSDSLDNIGTDDTFTIFLYKFLIAILISLISFPVQSIVAFLLMVLVFIIRVFIFDLIDYEFQERFMNQEVIELIDSNYELNSIGLLIKKRDKKVDKRKLTKEIKSIELTDTWTKEGAISNIDKTIEALSVFSIESSALKRTRELVNTIEDITLFDVQLNKCLTSIVEIINVSLVVGTLTTNNQNIINDFLSIVEQENLNVVDRVSDSKVGYLKEYAEKVKADIS